MNNFWTNNSKNKKFKSNKMGMSIRNNHMPISLEWECEVNEEMPILYDNYKNLEMFFRIYATEISRDSCVINDMIERMTK